jgi:hypothetical protein
MSVQLNLSGYMSPVMQTNYKQKESCKNYNIDFRRENLLTELFFLKAFSLLIFGVK